MFPIGCNTSSVISLVVEFVADNVPVGVQRAQTLQHCYLATSSCAAALLQ